MRLTSLARSSFVQPSRSSQQPAVRRAATQPVDSFVAAAAPAKAPSAAKELLGEQALESTLNALVEKLSQVLGRALERLFSRVAPKAPAPAQPAAAAPVAEAPKAGGLAPTPLAKDVPGQVAYVNTIQDPHVAPKSVFRDAVNSAIDAVRAKGLGIDPQDPDAITDFDAYHQGVVQELRARGYSAAYDGEELAVGRRGDSFSEQFDISTWQGRVRRFYASHLSPAVWG